MLLNILLALTNVIGLIPVYSCYVRGDIPTALILFYTVTFSFLSHLVENHKHDMIGIGLSRRHSYILNRLDVLFCFITLFRFLQVYNIFRDYRFVTFTLKLLIINLISEYYTPRHMYVITHSIWHVGIYLLMNNIVNS